MNIQPEFRALTAAALSAAQAAFGERLIAFYLHGSVAMGDAIPQVSDLDAMLVLKGAVNADDRLWQENAQNALVAQYPVADEVHLNLIDQQELAQNRFACFALRYNASLLHGDDIASALPCPAPDAAMAKPRLAFARQCFEQALAGQQPDCTGSLPEDPCYRARKFARYFVVIEGAYYLMSQGKFTSFAADEVLPALEAAAPEHAQALQLTRAVLRDAQNTGITSHDYLYAIFMLVKWLFDQIDKP